jgi:hypothetical protein
MKKLGVVVLLLLASCAARAQHSVHFARIQEVTREQVLKHELNEHQLIPLARINQQVLPLVFDAKTEEEMAAMFDLYKSRLLVVFPPEFVAILIL